MSDEKSQQTGLDELYEDYIHHVNTGGKTIHAKRVPGTWRNIKWISATVWLIFFLGPYLRWGDRQAVLFDIPNRQFHIFGLSVYPQDFWMLSLVLLFFAILLAVVTTMAGRVYCGYFCFQTVWTDVFTWIEEKLEGNPAQRRKLDDAPWSFGKIRIKLAKNGAWLVISALTGLSFAAWFTDAFQLWHDYFTLQAPSTAWIVLGLFTAGTWFLAGTLREQACFWLCPYARIQAVMVDAETLVPTYDYRRGEPRGRMRKGEDRNESGLGDCVDCGQCLAVCPTGVDIRHGQQEGCITCGLCIDACDQVMDKIGLPHGLVRYASLDEIDGKPVVAMFRRPRVIVYLTILTIAIIGIVYGLTTMSTIDMKVLRERQPMFVQMSDGTIQNKYTIKVMNKTDRDLHLHLTAEGPKGLKLIGAEEGGFVAENGRVNPFTVFVRVPQENLDEEMTPLTFHVDSKEDPAMKADYESSFAAPRR
ncbi:cytochrome c oxidase accessory protein CcoG [Endothiovibrio diazotrophicus]